MELLVIRHAIAEDREAFARTEKDDARRPLTKEGRRKMARASRGLRVLVPELARIVTSPADRARETAEIVAATYRCAPPIEAAVLAPDSDAAPVIDWLALHKGDRVAVVGHEPQLGLLVARLLSGRERSFVQLKKGAVCLLDLGDEPQAGSATLLWALQPGQLRRIRR